MASRVDLLDKNVNFGAFTWSNVPISGPNPNQEIDLEFSRWSEDGAPNAQDVIQPWETSGNRFRWYMNLNEPVSQHSFKWQPQNIMFKSVHQGVVISSWTYTGPDNPIPGENVNFRFNLWLVKGSSIPPSNDQEAEVIIKNFQFQE